MKPFKKTWALLASLILAGALCAGCEQPRKNEEETQEELITHAIESSDPSIDVHVGDYQSILTGAVDPIEEGAQSQGSSAILDMPKDQPIRVLYNQEAESLSAATFYLNNVVYSNDDVQTITVQDRFSEFKENLLTLTAGNMLSVSIPGGFQYGEVYQIEIHNAPSLYFENKSPSIRKLTIEIEDDPNEEAEIDVRDYKDDIVNIDLTKVSDEREDPQSETFSFLYHGEFPSMKEGDIFYAGKQGEPNPYFDFYGLFQSRTPTEKGDLIIYTAPRAQDIYDDLRLKQSAPLDSTGYEVLLTKEILLQKWKESALPRVLLRTLYPYMKDEPKKAGSFLSSFSVGFDIDMVDSRLGMKFHIGLSNFKLKDNLFFSIEYVYEKVTDYTIDFDVSVDWKWGVIPVGVRKSRFTDKARKQADR